MTEEIRALVLERAPADEIAAVADARGHARLRDDGLEKVKAGRHVDRRGRARDRHRLI